MQIHLCVLKSDGIDLYSKFGIASQSRHIFLKFFKPLPEGETIAIKLVGFSDKSYLLDGPIVSCTCKQNNQFILQVDVGQRLATISLQIAMDRAAAKNPDAVLDRVYEKPEMVDIKPTATSDEAKVVIEADKRFVANDMDVIDAGEIIKTNEFLETDEEIETIEAVESVATEETSGNDAPEISLEMRALPEENTPTEYSEEKIPSYSTEPLGKDEILWLVNQEETLIDFYDEEEPVLKEEPAERTYLTDDERQKAEPVAKFLINLTKAISRSGYYDPTHPNSADAKKGLHEEFLNVVGMNNELVFIRDKSLEKKEISIAGVVDELVSVRKLVGPAMAEVFLPKLIEYYYRKGMISFAIRKTIPLPQFERFIDIMSDFKLDQYDSVKAGGVLTDKFIEYGITDISIVFLNDRIELGLELPWRVEMAIQRLAKDFRMIPMFKDYSSENLKKLKMQTISDILRPLKRPQYYNDFLVNIHVIKRAVKDISFKELEKMIVDNFPLDLLIPISRCTFLELDQLEKLKSKQSEKSGFKHKEISIRRVLMMIAQRVAINRPPGAAKFLAKLYRDELIKFEELPPEVRYLILLRKVADDIIINFPKYESNLRKPAAPESALISIQCLRRAVPMLMDDSNYDTLKQIALLMQDASIGQIMQSETIARELKNVPNNMEMQSSSKHPEGPELYLSFVYGPTLDVMVRSFVETDIRNRKKVGEFIESMGPLGIRVMNQILTETKDGEIRKAVVASLIGMGEMGRTWALKSTADKQNNWDIHYCALMILQKTSSFPEDFEAVRAFMTHENERLREEAIGLVSALRPSDAEALIIDALDDPEARVRWRAMRALSDISPISDATIHKIIEFITASASNEKHGEPTNKRKLMNLIIAIKGLPEVPAASRMEKATQDLIWKLTEKGRGLLGIFKKGAVTDEDIGVLKASLLLLSRIGTTASAEMLTKIRRQVSQLAGEIESTLRTIQKRGSLGSA